MANDSNKDFDEFSAQQNEKFISAKISESYMDMLCLFDELNNLAQDNVIAYIKKLIIQKQTNYFDK